MNNNYYYEKSKFYYELFLAKKLTRKVTAVVVNNNKILVLTTKNGAQLPGGSVDNGETPKQALFRELKEETGITINNNTKYIGKLYYNVDWVFKEIPFVNKRVEYFYFCSTNDTKTKALGIKGEFDNNTISKWIDIKDLKNVNLNINDYNLIIPFLKKL